MSANGDVAEILYAGPKVAAPLGKSAKEEKPSLRFIPLGELLVQPEEEVRWLVEDRLPAAGLSLLAGRPKVGKSTLARCLALAVAQGEPWLGFRTRKGGVFYLALEEKQAEVRRHFAAMGAQYADQILVYCARAPQEGVHRLREATEQHRPVLIIIDPLLRLVHVRDANDYALVYAGLEPLIMLGRETGAHLLVVHHLGKGERGGGEAILGSTAFFATADTSLILKRADKYRTLSTIQRYGPDMPEVTLHLDESTGWVTAGPTRYEVDEEDAQRSILEVLAGQDNPADEPTILAGAEGRRAILVRALRVLVQRGKVVRTGGGRRGDPYRYAAASMVSESLVLSFPHSTGNEKNENQPITPHHSDGGWAGTEGTGSPLLPGGFNVPEAAGDSPGDDG